jgi:mRNA interferase MazF
VWEVALDSERQRTIPALVISSDDFNHGPSGLVILVPLTTVDDGIPLHVRIERHELGLRRRSFAKPEDVRAISTTRLVRRVGAVSAEVMAAVETGLRLVLSL